MNYIYILISVATLLCSFNLYGQQKERTFELPAIPATLTVPADRAAYLVEHYWDRFPFTDTVYCQLPDVTEQAFVNYLDLLHHVSSKQAEQSVEAMIQKTEVSATMSSYMAELYEKYLNDAESPLRNESLFIVALRQQLKAKHLSEVEKIRPNQLLALALKNRPGEPATDFSYVTVSGKRGALSEIVADYLLLLFYDPDCEDCQETIARLKESPRIVQLTKSSRLQIMAVYPGEELASWRQQVAKMPSGWIHVQNADQRLINEELYNLQSYPTLYLLDGDKRVLLKETSLAEVESYLSRL